MTTLSDDQIKYARYKWEFLRRNPEYVKDWQKLQETLEEFWLVDWVGGSPPGEIMIKEEIEFCKKWKMGCHLPPDSSYDDLTTYIHERHPIPDEESKDENSIDFDSIVFAVDEWSLTRWSKLGIDLHRIMFDRLFPEFIHWRPLVVEDGWEYERDGDQIRRHFSYKVAQSGILTVKVDLNHSKNRLINEWKDFINEWKELYDTAFIRYQYRRFCDERGIRSHPINDEDIKKDFEEIYVDRLKERKEKYERKYHFDNYELYLQVYDLRQEGMSWTKIKSQLDLNSVQTARNHYKAACELIEKGIELYVK